MRDPDLLQFPPLMSLYVDNKLGMEETQLIKSLAAVRGAWNTKTGEFDMRAIGNRDPPWISLSLWTP